VHLNTFNSSAEAPDLQRGSGSWLELGHDGLAGTKASFLFKIVDILCVAPDKLASIVEIVNESVRNCRVLVSCLPAKFS
jgi:hypothetical protein